MVLGNVEALHGGTGFAAKVLLQTNGENLKEVREEIRTHLRTDFRKYLAKLTLKKKDPLAAYKVSLLRMLEGPPDSFLHEVLHFLHILDSPRLGGKEVP